MSFTPAAAETLRQALATVVVVPADQRTQSSPAGAML